MACIRRGGLCPCPRCKMPMSAVHLFGTDKDRNDRELLSRIDKDHYQPIAKARDAIYRFNLGVDSASVEEELKPTSLTPTLVCPSISSLLSITNLFQNAFSSRLSKFMNCFNLFVVDLMHEVELGTWKGTLTHIIRMLQSLDDNLLNVLDKR
jgi:hypothetical protein